MKTLLVASACLAIATSGLIAGATIAQIPATKAEKSAPDLKVMRVQVLLDRLGFAPGVVDGKGGQSLVKALRGFQRAREIPVTGKVDAATIKLLSAYREIGPVATVVLTRADLAGPFIGKMPKDPALQAKLPTLGYGNRMEALAEKFHTTPATLLALNSPATRLAPGAKIRVPNVLADTGPYDAKLTPLWRGTLASLGVSARQPAGSKIIVDKSDGVLMVFNKQDQLVAQFPVTTGSGNDPLPIGTWKVQGAAYNPPFHYNPDLFWDVDDNKPDQMLKPGPNSPVGVVWLDINKPHYGIHGTPSPETIGRAESHGCIRLSNWDAARLSLMIKPGTPAIFRS
jgi:lipoprotein-anchoring transpeptidase ErfK/SrfK